MKLLTVALVSALAVCVKGDLEAMMALAKECKEKVGATSEDLAKLKTEGVPVTKEQKCFMSCILTAEKLVKDGKLAETAMMELAKKFTNEDAEKMKAVESILKACNHISGDDDCDTNAKIGMCLKTEGEKKKVLFGM